MKEQNLTSVLRSIDTEKKKKSFKRKKTANSNEEILRHSRKFILNKKYIFPVNFNFIYLDLEVLENNNKKYIK